jgi:acyl-CoA synthetase (NDP forming)
VSRDLRPLFAPRSVAVVGASADPLKWGNVLARGALRGARRRKVFLINRADGEILRERVFTSLGELPEAPELAVICLPAAGFEQAAGEALAAGARALVAITSGLGEHDEEGRQVEIRVAERVRAAGAVMLGPNCMGVFDSGEELDLGWSELPQGPIALVSQSGNLALELARLAAGSGLGFSRFASLGNQADLVAADFLDELTPHEPTRLIALYLEDFRDGRAFVEAAARATETGLPVLLLSGGVSGASAQAAVSHTGALVSDTRAIEAACRAGGIVRVTTPRELVDAAQALLARRFPRGRRVAVYADGGGHGVIAGDVLAVAGLEVPALSEATTAGLREHLPETASVANPVDFAGGGERGLASYADVGRLLFESPDVDAVLLTGYFGGYGVDTPELEREEIEAARDLAAAATETGGVLAVHTAYADSAAAAELRRGSVPVYADVKAAVAALVLLAEQAQRERPSLVSAELPEPVAPPAPGYEGACAFLAEAGIPMSEARSVRTSAQAVAAADEIGYPVALKAAHLVHKSDAGAVVLRLTDAKTLARAFDDVASRTGSETLSIERMAPLEDGLELIVGAKRDPRFGPIVLVGLGGLYAELLDDVAVALAPTSEEEALTLLSSLRAAPLLEGARGLRPLDTHAAASAVAALSRAAAACPDIMEIEVNPLLVLPEGALGLDARIALSS